MCGGVEVEGAVGKGNVGADVIELAVDSPRKLENAVIAPVPRRKNHRLTLNFIFGASTRKQAFFGCRFVQRLQCQELLAIVNSYSPNAQNTFNYPYLAIHVLPRIEDFPLDEQAVFSEGESVFGAPRVPSALGVGEEVPGAAARRRNGQLQSLRVRTGYVFSGSGQEVRPPKGLLSPQCDTEHCET